MVMRVVKEWASPEDGLEDDEEGKRRHGTDAGY